MPLLLNIDTATEYASVCISKNETVLGFTENSDQKNHAAFIQPAIQKLMMDTGYALPDIDAVAVTYGPGSYTGLRVGLATAKGICFALDKKLILVNTLEVMAQAMITHFETKGTGEHLSSLLCPMIDARRMEVFAAHYNSHLQEIKAPYAIVIDEHSYSHSEYPQPIIFSGSGHNKLKQVLLNKNVSFLECRHSAADLAKLALKSFASGHFADLAYSEPLYVKAFYDTSNPLNKG